MYTLTPTDFFLKQIEQLEQKDSKLLELKLKLLKINPYRFKRIKGYNLFLFRIRLRKKRVVYLIEKGIIKIICILDRKNNYRDLKRYLNK